MPRSKTLNVYLNGQLDNGALVGTVTSTQQNAAVNVNIGQRPGVSGFAFNGTLDEVHIFNRPLSQVEIQSDMVIVAAAAPVVPAQAQAVACTRATPLVSVTAASSGGLLAGTAASYTVTVTNRDSTGCSASAFSLVASVPAGWVTNALSSLLLSPGASLSTTLLVTSLAGAANGSNVVSVSATNQSATTFASLATATYVVSNAAPGVPIIGSATAGNAQATVSFAAPSSNGGSAITSYTVTSSPGNLTATGAGSPLTVTGLTNGTAYTFTVRATNSVGSSAASSASNAVTPVAPSAQLATSASCSATSGPLTLNAGSSRPSGVAPLAVVFNASGSTHTGLTAYATQPFHEIQYTWNFGDAAGDSKGNTAWSYGTRTGAGSKNIAYGPVAAHVFDPVAGSGSKAYIVNVSAFDGTNTATCSLQVTVDDPNVVFSGTKTTCVSSSSLPVAGSGGCPAGSAVAQQSNWPTIVGSHLGTGKRVLLKGNGDVYTGASNASLAVTGPAMIGMFGAGSKPVIRTTSTSGSIAKLTGTISDLRLVDLDFDGQGVTTTSAMTSSAVRATKILWQRVDIRSIGCGVDLEETQAAAAPDSLAFFDSTIQNLNSSGGSNCPIGLRFTGSNVAVMGNLFNNSTAGNAEHLARMHWLDRGVISNNTIQQGHSSKEMLSIRALDSVTGRWGLTGDAIATKYVIVSDNRINSNTYAGIQTVFSGDGSDRDLWRDILIERNFIPVSPGGGVAIRLLGSRITVRNNVMDMTSSGEQIGIVIDRAYAGIAAPSNIAIYNNTIYSGASGSGFAGMILSSGSSGISVKNNLVYAPNSSGPLVVQNQGSQSATITNNTTEGTTAGGVKTSPLFAVMPPTVPAHFKPICTGTTYPCGKGVGVPVWVDFLGIQPTTRDLGALNH